MRHIDMPRTGRSRGRFGAVLVAAALVAVSCGSDNKGSTTPTAGGTAAPAAATAAPANTTAAAPADTTAAASSDTTAAPVGDKVTDFAGYIGGTGAADASLSPIKIGYFNQQGGAVEVTHTNVTGIQAAVKFVNEQAGGIGGHPLEVVTCYIANTEEEGQQCGQQFANDSSIVAIETGPTFIGTESFYAAVAGSK
ncbi:MAG: branched-chain amino acid transport system substrate-binding protein, partial [Ilumatobacteraceae bacterium]